MINETIRFLYKIFCPFSIQSPSRGGIAQWSTVAFVNGSSSSIMQWSMSISQRRRIARINGCCIGNGCSIRLNDGSIRSISLHYWRAVHNRLALMGDSSWYALHWTIVSIGRFLNYGGWCWVYQWSSWQMAGTSAGNSKNSSEDKLLGKCLWVTLYLVLSNIRHLPIWTFWLILEYLTSQDASSRS